MRSPQSTSVGIGAARSSSQDRSTAARSTARTSRSRAAASSRLRSGARYRSSSRSVSRCSEGSRDHASRDPEGRPPSRRAAPLPSRGPAAFERRRGRPGQLVHPEPRTAAAPPHAGRSPPARAPPKVDRHRTAQIVAEDRGPVRSRRRRRCRDDAAEAQGDRVRRHDEPGRARAAAGAALGAGGAVLEADSVPPTRAKHAGSGLPAPPVQTPQGLAVGKPRAASIPPENISCGRSRRRGADYRRRATAQRSNKRGGSWSRLASPSRGRRARRCS